MAIKTTAGRGAIGQALLDQADTMFLAWGSGSPDWDGDLESYPVDETMTELVAEIGRRIVTYACFATPDDGGELVTVGGKYTESVDPTPFLFLRFSFVPEDSPLATIREVGLFLFCEKKANLPAGKTYFLPSEIDDNGLMMAVDRFSAVARSPDAVQDFGFVLPL